MCLEMMNVRIVHVQQTQKPIPNSQALGESPEHSEFPGSLMASHKSTHQNASLRITGFAFKTLYFLECHL